MKWGPTQIPNVLCSFAQFCTTLNLGLEMSWRRCLPKPMLFGDNEKMLLEGYLLLLSIDTAWNSLTEYETVWLNMAQYVSVWHWDFVPWCALMWLDVALTALSFCKSCLSKSFISRQKEEEERQRFEEVGRKIACRAWNSHRSNWRCIWLDQEHLLLAQKLEEAQLGAANSMQLACNRSKVPSSIRLWLTKIALDCVFFVFTFNLQPG